MIKEKNIGSSLEDFLKEENRYEEAQTQAIKRVLVWQLEEAMKKEEITKSEMARKMKTSRSQLDRLLDPDNQRICLLTKLSKDKVGSVIMGKTGDSGSHGCINQCPLEPFL